MEKLLKYYLIFCAIFLPLFIIFGLIVYPAYGSYKDDNNKTLWKEDLAKGNIVGYAWSNGTVVVLNNSTITLRHELTHKYFAEHNIHINKMLEEMIAYTNQYALWEKVNITSMDWER